MPGARRIGPGRAGLVGVLALSWALAHGTPAAAAGPAAEASKAKPLRHPGKPSGRRASLNDRVATLTKALRLDPQQQAELRTVLQGQREQVQRIWNDETMSSGDRLVATKGVGHRTADQIRALLNEEQRKKFDPAPEHDPDSTVGKANVEEWMKRR